MISLEEAREYVLAGGAPLGTVRVPLLDALGAVAAERVAAAEPVPPFANTAMDGYAVRAADTDGAGPDAPVTLPVVGELPAERVAVAAAAGRFLAEPVVAPIDLPGFDNSAMDGYAVRAADVAGAGADSPVALKLIGTTAAGEAMRIFTGAPIPDGADAVVMVEATERLDDGASVALRIEVAPATSAARTA